MNNTIFSPDAYVQEAHYRGASPGNHNNQVRKMQEWLNFLGYYTAVDGIWGPATTRTLERFCGANGFEYSNELTVDIWRSLISPMTSAMSQKSDLSGQPFGDAVYLTALQYLEARELGGNNKGPWVRLFMKGLEGSQWPWCAGFVSHLIAQASYYTGIPKPIKYTFSSSKIIQYGRETGRFTLRRNLKSDQTYIFCIKGGGTGYSHTGFAFDIDLDGEVFMTIEGNTNLGGSSEGDSVKIRTRNIHTADFVSLN